ncbi:MAG: hypothetical protein RLY20_958 [Verrucomicrobiota bacterium]|jgi:hypothetical protein
MAQEQHRDAEESPGSTIRFSALGLTVFSVGLVLVSTLATLQLVRRPEVPSPTLNISPASDQAPAKPTAPIPPWGEFVEYDINLEQPDEYLGFELANTNRAPQWTFSGMDRAQARQLMLDSGVAPAAVSRALSDQFSTMETGSVAVHPDANLLGALSPEVRAKLYGRLGKLTGNPYMTCPFCYSRKSFQEWFGDHAQEIPGMAIARKLFYPRGDGVCFSDLEFLLRQLHSDDERMHILKLLSRQSAVLVRVRIRPNTDVEGLLNYWCCGAPLPDVQPLVESTARLPEGATISLLYFLPKFARERLYTFPMLTWQPDPVMDCHWSTMNFFNDPPDDRFTGTSNTVPYLKTNYVEVAQPDKYGDVILILNSSGKPVHSAVHLADDIVFTKNGYNAAQPWMLMHLNDLLTRYTDDGPPKMLVYRKPSH